MQKAVDGRYDLDMLGSRLRRLGIAAATCMVLVACASDSPATTPTGSADIEGGNASKLPSIPPPTQPTVLPNPSTPNGEEEYVTGAFDDMQVFWSSSFTDAGLAYTPANLDLFTSAVGTACGAQTAEVGPFYCSGDDTVYLDLHFFAALKQKIGVSGDFPLAYVVAHEMGHHVQNLLGITQRVAVADQHNLSGSNGLSIRVELQADCLAGVWAHSTYQRSLLQPGDLDEALTAAAAVGDDFLQQLSIGQVEPESWTHGSSAQRQHWLTAGFDSGKPSACDTFSRSI